MGILNQLLRDSATVPTPDSGRLNVFADISTGKLRSKNSSGVVADYVGPVGVRGSSITSGTAVPSASGLTGDLYFKTDNGAVYQYSGSAWVLIANVTGPAGTQPAMGSSATDVGTTSSPGSASTASRSDHQHAHGNQAGGSLHSAATGSTAGFLSATDKGKIDGFGALASSSTDVSSSASSAGSSTNLARQDHSHFHGNLPGGLLHAVATAETPGFMGSADKTKLDNIVYPAAPAPVQSVASKTGNVLLTSTDVGLSNVQNPAVVRYQSNASLTMNQTPTSAGTLTITASKLSNGATFHITAYFASLVNTVAPSNLVVTVAVNGTALATATAALGTTAVPAPGRGASAEFRLVFRFSGPSGSAICNGNVLVNNLLPVLTNNAAGTTVNTTSAVTVDVQVSTSVATTTGTVQSVSITPEV